MLYTLTSGNYDEIVTNSKETVLIDFWASWCGPCKMIAPIVEEIAEEYENIKVCKVNVDEEPVLPIEFKVSAIPTLVVVKNSQETNRSVGYIEKSDIIALLEE